MVKKEIKKGDCSLFFPFLPVSFFIKEKYFTIMWNKKGKSVVKLSVNIKRCHLRIKHAPVSRRRS